MAAQNSMTDKAPTVAVIGLGTPILKALNFFHESISFNNFCSIL
jgi:hypothetical protein